MGHMKTRFGTFFGWSIHSIIICSLCLHLKICVSSSFNSVVFITLLFFSVFFSPRESCSTFYITSVEFVLIFIAHKNEKKKKTFFFLLLSSTFCSKTQTGKNPAFYCFPEKMAQSIFKWYGRILFFFMITFTTLFLEYCICHISLISVHDLFLFFFLLQILFFSKCTQF